MNSYPRPRKRITIEVYMFAVSLISREKSWEKKLVGSDRNWRCIQKNPLVYFLQLIHRRGPQVLKIWSDIK